MNNNRNYTGLTEDELEHAAFVYCKIYGIDPMDSVQYNDGTLAMRFRYAWESAVEEIKDYYEQRFNEAQLEGIVDAIVRNREKKNENI